MNGARPNGFIGADVATKADSVFGWLKKILSPFKIFPLLLRLPV